MEETGVDMNEQRKEEERKKWRMDLGKDLWNIQEKWNNGQVLQKRRKSEKLGIADLTNYFSDKDKA